MTTAPDAKTQKAQKNGEEEDEISITSIDRINMYLVVGVGKKSTKKFLKETCKASWSSKFRGYVMHPEYFDTFTKTLDLDAQQTIVNPLRIVQVTFSGSIQLPEDSSGFDGLIAELGMKKTGKGYTGGIESAEPFLRLCGLVNVEENV